MHFVYVYVKYGMRRLVRYTVVCPRSGSKSDREKVSRARFTSIRFVCIYAPSTSVYSIECYVYSED